MVTPFREITNDVVNKFPDSKIGVHCHNDAGVGVAVSITGVEAGAVMVQGTMNGYGERNGNANLTTIIPNLELKMDYTTNCSKHLEKLRDLSCSLMMPLTYDPISARPMWELHPSPTKVESMQMRLLSQLEAMSISILPL